MVTKFHISGKGNPCPVCGRTKDGDCRTTDDGLVLCHTYQDGEPGDVITGRDRQQWAFLKRSDIWGVYAPHKPLDKTPRSAGSREFIYYGLDGIPVVKVLRRDDGQGNKKISQSHWAGSRWISGGIDQVASQIHLYRISEARQLAEKTGKPVLIVEGEPCVDALMGLRIPATTSIGGAGKWRKYGYRNYLKDLAGMKAVLCPDCDRPGLAHMEEIAQDLGGSGIPVVGWLLAPPKAPWTDPPAKGGLDVADWISQGATADQIWAAIQDDPPQSLQSRDPDSVGAGDPEPPEDSPAGFYHRCRQNLLGSDHWIFWDGSLYRWGGTHYEAVSTESVKYIVWKFAAQYEVRRRGRDGLEYKAYPYSTPSYVKNAIEWIQLSCTVAAVNPPGINCTNGFLELLWDGDRLIPRLSPHSPDRLVLTPPSCEYNPQADPAEYERLMECLDPASRQIWERTIAASLDLSHVRKYQGRGVKALLLKGGGANGKDTLRAITQQLLGSESLANTSTSDWQAYDNGTYFKVSGIRGKRISWASETSDIGRIEQLQGLKAAITGDPITIERKYKDVVKEPLAAVFLFSINEMPNISTALKAIESRWGIVPFDKTYSSTPREGELLADPRFKEDPCFIRERILPAFLNTLLRQLQAVVREGINYSATQDLLDEISREANHLQQFAQDVGLIYDPNSRIPVQQLWERLEQWYQENGYLTYETGSRGAKKAVWSEPARRGDRLVKGIRLIVPEMVKVFPRARRVVEGGHGKPQVTYLQGVSLKNLGTKGTKGTEPLQDKPSDPVPKNDGVPNLGTDPTSTPEQPVPKSTQNSTQNGYPPNLGTIPKTLTGKGFEPAASTQSTQSTQNLGKNFPEDPLVEKIYDRADDLGVNSYEVERILTKVTQCRRQWRYPLTLEQYRMALELLESTPTHPVQRRDTPAHRIQPSNGKPSTDKVSPANPEVSPKCHGIPVGDTSNGGSDTSQNEVSPPKPSQDKAFDTSDTSDTSRATYLPPTSGNGIPEPIELDPSELRELTDEELQEI